MEYPCGCINETEPNSSILHCLKKCDFHITWSKDFPQGGSIGYFIQLGAIRDGVPQNLHLVNELITALSLEDQMFLTDGYQKSVLEIGCGLGAYIPMFLSGHWNYMAVEQAEFCVEWVRKTFYVRIKQQTVEEYLTTAKTFDCIFAAHVFEHLDDAPAVVRQCYEKVNERIYIIVPDDSDQTNPDHYWFFTKASLHHLLEQVGFKNVRSQIHKRVPQENFIYCVAEK